MAPPPKVLAGGPARETESRVFRLHRERLEAQGSAFDLTIRHDVVVDPGGERWRLDKIQRVARARQVFMDAAAGYDALLMVDTDVILGPGVLERLWSVNADVVYGVYWTRADWGGQPGNWPQVWDLNPYGWRQETADALLNPGVNEVEVFGGGACTLIRGRGFESHYWPLLRSLERHPNMFAGEDRTYCLGLECRGIKQVAVTGLPIHHCYTLAEQTRPALKRIEERLLESDALRAASSAPPYEIGGYADWEGQV